MRRYPCGPRLLQQFLHMRTECGPFQASPEEAVWKRVACLQYRAKQIHHALIATAVAGNDKAEPVAGIDQTLGQSRILRGEIRGKVLQTVITEVAVELAVDREFFIVQGLICVL